MPRVHPRWGVTRIIARVVVLGLLTWLRNDGPAAKSGEQSALAGVAADARRPKQNGSDDAHCEEEPVDKSLVRLLDQAEQYTGDETRRDQWPITPEAASIALRRIRFLRDAHHYSVSFGEVIPVPTQQ